MRIFAAMSSGRRGRIPIVFATVADPVASGIVPRLNQPGGNTTGLALYEATLGGKWLELLSEIAPGLKRAAIMFDPDTTLVSIFMPSLESAARSLKVVPIITPVHSDAEIETAIIALGREPGGGLVVMPDAFLRCIACRSYWRWARTRYRRSIGHLLSHVLRVPPRSTPSKP
jgi:hypothetical protein